MQSFTHWLDELLSPCVCTTCKGTGTAAARCLCCTLSQLGQRFQWRLSPHSSSFVIKLLYFPTSSVWCPVWAWRCVCFLVKPSGISQFQCNCVIAVGKCSHSFVSPETKMLKWLGQLSWDWNPFGLKRTSFVAEYRLLVMFPVDLAVTVAFICRPVLGSLILEEAWPKNLPTETAVLHKPCQLENVVSSSTLRLPEKITFSVLLRGFTALLSVHVLHGFLQTFAKEL